jgi:hypothetical protein
VSYFPVFPSAVSREFGSARDAPANDLHSHDIPHRILRGFRPNGKAGTLLHKLKNYIETCGTVVCLMGESSMPGHTERIIPP